MEGFLHTNFTEFINSYLVYECSGKLKDFFSTYIYGFGPPTLYEKSHFEGNVQVGILRFPGFTLGCVYVSTEEPSKDIIVGFKIYDVSIGTFKISEIELEKVLNEKFNGTQLDVYEWRSK